MNKTIKDWPQISRYCDWDYFREHLNKMVDFDCFGIYPQNTLLEINFWFNYDIQVNWIKKDEIQRLKDRQIRERYSFNCFNKILWEK